MKTNIITEEIYKVLKANRVYRKALKNIDYNHQSYIDVKFISWFTWRDSPEGFDFWQNMSEKVESHFEVKCDDPKFRLGVYEYLLTVFEKDCGRDVRLGFCHESGELLNFLPELKIQKPRNAEMFWWPRVSGKDENRCNALLEAIRLVKLEIEASEALSTIE
jgi:hypothetical protein